MELRKAIEADLPVCAQLIYLSASNIYRSSFGAEDERNHRIFATMLSTPGSLFSLEFVTVAKMGDKIQGALLAYPGAQVKELNKGMRRLFLPFLKQLGLLRMLRVAKSSDLNRYYPEPESDEFYVANLAVFPEARGKGLGLALLKEAERLAKTEGLPKLSLNVELDNSNGIRIYEKFGFQKVAEIELPRKYKKVGIQGFYRMVKPFEVR